MEGTIGEIRMFAGDFAPRSWAFCNGQLLPISSNTALFSILGTIYGGDGRSTLALPDLRGRVAIHAGEGRGLTPHHIGQRGGSETNTLTSANLPPHNHSFNLGNKQGNTVHGNNNYIAAVNDDGGNNSMYTFDKSSNGDSLNHNTIGSTGGGQSINNLPPYLAVNYIICISGTFPSRDY